MKIFYKHKSEGLFWFRIFGYGVSIKDLKKNTLRFSERNGFKNLLIINRYAYTILKPNRP